MMNTALIKKWIERNNPQGATKLAGRAEINTGTLNKILNHEHSPGVDIAKRMAEVIGVTLDQLCKWPEEAVDKINE